MLVQTKQARAVVSHTIKHLAEHPFLVTRKSEYAALQARAEHSPWREMKAAAIHDVATVNYHADKRIDIRSIVLASIFSTTALAYILDPAHRPKYVRRIVDHFSAFDLTDPRSITAEMRGHANKMSWIHGTPTGNAFFQAVLALDIIYDELSPAELARIEAMLRDGPAKYFAEIDLPWKQGTLAARAIWPIYERNAAVYEPIVKRWHEDTLAAISADGVFTGGTGYADARWTAADRENKALFGEVLAHAGLIRGWYDEPKLASFHEWRNGYSYTPFRILWAFGDSGPDRFSPSFQPGPERAYRYSDLAGRYADWLREGATPLAGVGNYVFTERFDDNPAAPPSRVFPDGGAWLKETSVDPLSLAAGMWNVRTLKDLHCHKETNSLGLAAYGEMLLRAGGYAGWDTPAKEFSWTYIHGRAIAGNVALFDYAVPGSPESERNPSAENDHATVAGAGITESLITGVIDYALGDSGNAIPNGTHRRGLLFVHPADGANGYYVALDELSSDSAKTGHLVWHPNSADCVTTTADQEFTWTADEFGGRPVGLTIFLATSPSKTTLCDGVLANWNASKVGRYLVNNYPLSDAGKQHVATVLFPHDAEHAKADLSRVEGGAIVRQGDVIDRVFTGEGDTSIEIEPNVFVQARGGLFRRTTDAPPMVWLTGASKFAAAEFSFESSSPITLLRRGDDVRIATTEAANVRMSCPGLAAVSVEDSAFPLADNDNSVHFTLPPGTHALRLSRTAS